MKKFFIAILLLSFTVSVNAQKNPSITCNVKNISFGEFIHIVEKQTGIRVFYDPLLEDSLRVTVTLDSVPAMDALTKVLKGTKQIPSPWQKHIVILNNEEIPREIPVFNQKTKDTIQSYGSDKTADEDRYFSGRSPDVLETLIVGNKNIQANGIVNITGRITDEETGEPIIGATIFIEETKTGAATDFKGYFTILLPPGEYVANFSSMGYKPSKYKLKVYSEASLKIEMESNTFYLQEAVIKGDRQMDVRYKDPGMEKLTAKQIKSIPVMMGERDIIKVSEMLPGIVSVGEGSSGLNVRGGSSDQNAFYINNIPIYNTSHLFGFFPAFNSDIIKDFSIYKGHIPAEYGGRLSSVFNITSRQGNRKNFSLHGGVNPISTNITLEGPIKKDKSSVLLSARTLYSDWILSKIKDPTIKNSSAKFNDLSFGLNYDFENTSLSAFIYSSDDQFDLADINSYDYSNKGASINIYHKFNSMLRMNSSLVGSQYSFNTIDKQIVKEAYKHPYQINHYELRTDFTQTLNEKHQLDYGINGIYYSLNRGTVEPYGPESIHQTINHGTEKGVEAAIYLSDQYDLTSWLTINAGFRYSVYTALGKDQVYQYYENEPTALNNIRDTLHFASNEPIKWYKSPELRVSLNFETDPNGNIKLAFNQMSQNLFLLNNTISIAPNSQWKLADYHIKPSKNNQLSLGIFRNIPRLNLEASAEFFYKKTNHFTEFKDGADFINSPEIETEVLQGDQNSYGVELMLKKTSGKINGWLAYTYSRSFVQVDGVHDWDKINNGKIYPSNYDIPHVLNTVINYNISKRTTLSAVLTYQKGKPATYPVSIYYIDDTPLIDYSDRNEYRIPDYFRTDLSLTIEGNLKKDKLIHSSWMFSVYNVTGRKNAYSVYFISENGYIKSYKYAVIGTPFFTISWLFKLGNYASQ
ncbi:MAG: TonB-dependent receptor [Bacteroidales bacterium]|nr:TonB-dependent receptor [Bacteroidales bacterium]